MGRTASAVSSAAESPLFFALFHTSGAMRTAPTMIEREDGVKREDNNKYLLAIRPEPLAQWRGIRLFSETEALWIFAHQTLAVRLL